MRATCQTCQLPDVEDPPWMTNLDMDSPHAFLQADQEGFRNLSWKGLRL